MRNVLRILLWSASLAALAGYLFPVFHDLRHPRPLDPSERALLIHAERLVAGETLFREPANLASAPVMPGFPLVLAVLVGAFGAQPWQPRAISAAAILACAVLLALIILSETNSWTMSAAGGGVLLLGCGLLIPPAARGQTEALALLLVLAAFLCMRHVGEIPGALLGALLLAGACFTDSTALPFLVVATLHARVRDTRMLVAFTLGTALCLGGGYIWMSKALGPWFNYQASEALLQSFRFDGPGLIRLLGGELLGTFGVFTLTVVLSFALPVRPWRGAVGMWTWLAIGGVAAAVLASQNLTLESHALLPAMLGLALTGPLAMQRVTRHLSASPGAARFGGEGLMLAALALQFLQLVASAPPLPQSI